jgi:hypothetical protein
MVLVEVARGDDLNIFQAQELVRVTWPLHAPAGNTHDDATRRWGSALPAQGAGRDESGCGDGETGGGKETTAADA